MKLSLKILRTLGLINALLIAFCFGCAITTLVCKCGNKYLFFFLILIFAGISFSLNYLFERKKQEELK
jgi:hypothetical protein